MLSFSVFDNPITAVIFICVLLAGGGVLTAVLMSYGMMLATVRNGKKKVNEYTLILSTDLPGKNCGDCGYATCEECATAMLFQETSCASCPHCDIETARELRKTVERYWFLVETSNIPVPDLRDRPLQDSGEDKE